MSLPTPRLSTRGTAGYSFAELYLALGPQAIGETGDNSLSTLIGRVWALVLDADGRLRLFQRAELAATWAEQTTLLPPLFDETHPPERRRFSIAFDQSARANVAYEQDGAVYLTRWDATANAYVQNVTVPGVDPVVVFDATFAYDVTVSDVLLFYLSSDRTRLLCRVQRDIYAIERELHDYAAPVVLDRVTRLPLRYQALASDEAGDPLETELGRVGLLSALYPYPAADSAAGGALPPGAGDYILAILSFDEGDELDGSAAPASEGLYDDPIFRLSGEDEIGGSAEPAVDGDYINVLIVRTGSDELDGSAAPAVDGLYFYVLIPTSGSDELDGSGAPATGGTYATP